MKLLLDTHMLLWALTDDPKLPATARMAVLDPSNQIFYSAVSVWEVALKHGKRPDALSVGGTEFAAFCEQAGYCELPLSQRHITMLERLAYPAGGTPHRDPFDPILIAQAQAEGMKLLTHDENMARYGASCIWSA